MKAKKSLGQHFLKSERALMRIIESANPMKDDIVLEIGPGHGALTERLLAVAGKVIAVEKDRELIPMLEEKFAIAIEQKKIEIIEQDILKFDPNTVSLNGKHTYKLVANIPYYITGAIIEKFLSAQHQPQLMVLLMQREVAERIVARDGKQSILSIAVGVYSTPRIIDRVPPGAFVPSPTVESAILLIDDINREFFADCDEALFFSILKAVFGKKRKQIGGSLSEYWENTGGSREDALAALRTAGISLTIRPEELTRFQWKSLVQELHEISKRVYNSTYDEKT